MKRREEGFTLIELMIVIAIIAILAAVAVTQYNVYKRKAKAKDLISISRSCAQEIVAQCSIDPTSNVTVSKLESCGYNGTQSVGYLNNININVDQGSSTVADVNCDGASITVNTFGDIKGTGKTYKAICEITNYNNNAANSLSFDCKGVYLK